MHLFLALALLWGSVSLWGCDAGVDVPAASQPDTTGEQPPQSPPDDSSTKATSGPQVASPTSDATSQVGDVDPLPGGPAAATDLRADTRCDDTGSRKAVADLSWTVAVVAGSEQLVAVTKFREGFDTGNFDVSASLAADATSLTWRNVSPGGVQYWRVLTRHGNSWAPSNTAMFTGPTCVTDYVDPNPH
jgi:hypothetical protein